MIRIMPINHRMYPHKRRPAPIRGIEECELRAVWIRASGSDEDCLNGGCICEIGGEGFAHGFVVLREGEVVFGCG